MERNLFGLVYNSIIYKPNQPSMVGNGHLALVQY